MSSGDGGAESEPFLTSEALVFFNVLLWLVVPKAATDFVHSAWQRVRPGPRTPYQLWVERKRIFVLVIGVYMVFSVINSARSLPPNEYTHLDFAPALDHFDVQALRSHSRKLALALHPDRNPSPDAPEQFMAMKTATAILTSPHARRVHDNMGSANARECLDKGAAARVREEEPCSSYGNIAKDHLQNESLPFYIAWVVLLAAFSFFQSAAYATYWRVVIVGAVMCAEISVVMDQTPTLIKALLTDFWLTPHDAIELLHQLFPVFFVAMGQLGPTLFPTSPALPKEAAEKIEELTTRIAQGPLQVAEDIERRLRDGCKKQYNLVIPSPRDPDQQQPQQASQRAAPSTGSPRPGTPKTASRSAAASSEPSGPSSSSEAKSKSKDD